MDSARMRELLRASFRNLPFIHNFTLQEKDLEQLERRGLEEDDEVTYVEECRLCGIFLRPDSLQKLEFLGDVIQERFAAFPELLSQAQSKKSKYCGFCLPVVRWLNWAVPLGIYDKPVVNAVKTVLEERRTVEIVRKAIADAAKPKSVNSRMIKSEPCDQNRKKRYFTVSAAARPKEDKNDHQGSRNQTTEPNLTDKDDFGPVIVGCISLAENEVRNQVRDEVEKPGPSAAVGRACVNCDASPNESSDRDANHSDNEAIMDSDSDYQDELIGGDADSANVLMGGPFSMMTGGPGPTETATNVQGPPVVAVVQPSSSTQLQPSSNRKPSSWWCNSCNYGFVTISSFNEHRRVIHQGQKPNPFCCKRCSRFFTNKYGLRLHNIKVHDKGSVERWKCDTCGKRFNKKTIFDHHVHINNKSIFLCPELGCTYQAPNWTLVRQHLIEAHGHPTIKLNTMPSTLCHGCGRVFLKKHLFDNHFHTPEGNFYRCPFNGSCHFSAKHWQGVQFHMEREHVGEVIPSTVNADVDVTMSDKN